MAASVVGIADRFVTVIPVLFVQEIDRKCTVMKAKLGVGIVVLVLVGGGVLLWQQWQQQRAQGFFHTNGRLEATQSRVATRIPGLLAKMTVKEGDHVAAGQVLAELDSKPLQAEIVRADAAIAQANDQVHLADAQLVQAQAECNYARSQLGRVQSLSKQQFVSADQLDAARTRATSCGSVVNAASAAVEAARSAGKVAQAGRDRLMVDLVDSSIRAPFSGYILYRLAEAGEMIAAGSPLFTLVSDSEVYLTVFLPAEVAGKLALGDEARLQMDAKPDAWVPAKVTFVAAEAEFTPKSVETASERSNLVFRTRIGIDPAVLAQNAWLKSGMPGLGWLRVDGDATWPSAPSR